MARTAQLVEIVRARVEKLTGELDELKAKKLSLETARSELIQVLNEVEKTSPEG